MIDMSIGHSAHGRKIAEDETTVIYEYNCVNINKENYKQLMKIYDGEITICKNGLVEPEIHEKTKRRKNGRKYIEIKRIHNDVNYNKLLEEKKIVIKNCSNTWKSANSGEDFMALKLIWKIFDYYQDNCCMPKSITVYY